MAVRRRAIEYRSEHVWGDLPLVHVSVGGRQADGRYRLGRARGIIALGDIATGASGRRWRRHRAVERRRDRDRAGGAGRGGRRAGGGWAVAIGLFAAGAVAIGPTAVGPVTAGLLVAPRPPGGIAPLGDLGAEDGRPGGR